MSPAQEIARRRTFAIISHPDAGKTTLTEKLLLYGGALNLAGSVTARKQQRATTSDWMEIEKKRGISISSTVLQFDYDGYRVNLLDTPGHKDFSEDTYRVLTAVDAAVMVIDAGKGIEDQTRKLFEVCRQRGVPIFTFMNKLDRPSLDPLELIDQLESVLGISAYPMAWPLGAGPTFRGVYERRARRVHLFERASHGAYPAPVAVADVDDPAVRDRLDGATFATVSEELAMLDEAGAAYDEEAVRAGRLTPVYFGSAMNNFGVRLLLDGFLAQASPPGARQTDGGVVQPEDPRFSGFVFKIQANMDPRHRDRLAFIRVVSGRFDRDMSVIHTRTGARLRLSNAQALFGRERETVDQAYPGDVVGIVGGRDLRIGDTLSDDPALHYREIPRFPPECFAYLHNPNPSNYKRFQQGMTQLLQEGVIQTFESPRALVKVTLLGAVGPLQFEIVQHRLLGEYGAESRLQPASWALARWVEEDDGRELLLPQNADLVVDIHGARVVLFASAWEERFFHDRNPGVRLSAVPLDR